jgi:carbonic anhydrase
MCTQCGDFSGDRSTNLPRRQFVKLAGAGALSLGFFGRSQAAEADAPPKPQNMISPDEALERLTEGNHRYVSGKMISHDFISERPALASGQNPFAAVLGCADSRVAPEYAIDVSRGDVFVCRVAGNFVDVHSIASFEYAVAVLGTPLILVLGHSKCGAVDAAVKAVKEGESFPGHISHLVEAIRPAVKAAQSQSGDLLENAIKENVLLNVASLRTAGPILNEAVEQGRLKVAGGIYSLDTGRVTLVT